MNDVRVKTSFPIVPVLLAAAISATLLRGESPREPVDLMVFDNWIKAGDWAETGKVEGSTSEKKWKSIEPGKGILYNGEAGKTASLVSQESHGDAVLEVEFLIPKGSNSGLYLMQRYEIQILDSYGKADDAISYGDCGGIYERWDETKTTKDKGYEGTAPATNACTAPGTWQSFVISFRAPRFDADGNKTENARFVKVVHNGVVIHENVEVTGPTRGGAPGPEVADAPLSVQGDHGPVAFRKFHLQHTKFR